MNPTKMSLLISATQESYLGSMNPAYGLPLMIVAQDSCLDSMNPVQESSLMSVTQGCLVLFNVGRPKVLAVLIRPSPSSLYI